MEVPRHPHEALEGRQRRQCPGTPSPSSLGSNLSAGGGRDTGTGTGIDWALRGERGGVQGAGHGHKHRHRHRRWDREPPQGGDTGTGRALSGGQYRDRPRDPTPARTRAACGEGHLHSSHHSGHSSRPVLLGHTAQGSCSGGQQKGSWSARPAVLFLNSSDSSNNPLPLPTAPPGPHTGIRGCLRVG